MKKKFRPDLSDYDVYVMALADWLNADAAFRMSKTDVVKLAIEKAVKIILPDVVINQSGRDTLDLIYEKIHVHSAETQLGVSWRKGESNANVSYRNVGNGRSHE